MLVKIYPDRHVKPKPGLLGLYGPRRFAFNRYEFLASVFAGVVSATGWAVFDYSYGSMLGSFIFGFLFTAFVLLIGRKES